MNNNSTSRRDAIKHLTLMPSPLTPQAKSYVFMAITLFEDTQTMAKTMASSLTTSTLH